MTMTTSVFDALAMDETDRRVASRRALALAHTRVENRLGAFLQGAVTRDEFNARLAAVSDDLNHYVAEACEECGHDHPEHIVSSLIGHFERNRRWQPRGAALDTPFEKASVAPGYRAMGPPDPNSDTLTESDAFDMGFGMTPEEYARWEQQDPYASQMRPQQAAPGAAALADRLNTRPEVDPAYTLEQNRATPWQDPYQERRAADDSHGVPCPECGGDGKTANSGECPRCHGAGSVPNFGDSVLDHIAKLADSGNTGLGSPEPKIDKGRWTPQSVPKPAEESSGRWPTREKDIVQPIRAQNRDQDGHDLSEIGEQVTELVDLPAASANETGFYDGGETKGPTSWQGGDSQATPVTHETQ